MAGKLYLTRVAATSRQSSGAGHGGTSRCHAASQSRQLDCIIHASGPHPRNSPGPYEIVAPLLFVRRLGQPAATELPGTQGAAVPLFSPDGQWVAFIVGTKLLKISVEGGAAMTIADVSGPHVSGAHWGEEGSFLLSEAFGSLDGPFATGTRGTTRLPGDQVNPWTLRDVEPGKAYTIEGGGFLERAFMLCH